MSIFRTLFFLILVNGAAVAAQAQGSLDGVIREHAAGLPVPFAAIMVGQGTSPITFSDLEGRFSINVPDSVPALTLWHPRYADTTLVAPFADSLVIGWRPKEVAVTTAEANGFPNQASWAINNLWERRSAFDAAALAPFEQQEYSKAVAWLRADGAEGGGTPMPTFPQDSTDYLYFQETSAKNTYLGQGKEQKKILATKTLGLEDKTIVSLVNTMQWQSVFNSHLVLAHRYFQSPFHPKNFGLYHYHQLRLLPLTHDTLQVVAFEGKAGAHVLTFRGHVYISQKDGLPVFISLHYQEENGLGFSLHQHFEKVKEGIFYPLSSSLALQLPQFPRKRLNTYLLKTDYLSDMVFKEGLSFKKLKFGLVIFDNYSEKDEDFWEIRRQVAKYEEKEFTYIKKNLYADRGKIYRTYKIAKAFYQDELAVNVGGLMDLSNVFGLNRYEYVRLGLGLGTSDKISKTFRLGGYAAYGFRDGRWKFGSDITFPLHGVKDEYLSFSYVDDIREPGRHDFFRLNQGFFRNFLTNRMDILQRFRVAGVFRAFKYGHVELSAEQYRRKPAYEYLFSPMEGAATPQLADFQQVELGMRLRYAFRERVARTQSETYSLGSAYPVIYLNYSKGLADVLESDFSFHKASIQTNYDVYVNRLGTSKIILEMGITSDDLPYSLLFNGRGGNASFGGSSGFFIRDAFQTMGLYEFVSNQYFNIFYSHDFGSLLFDVGKFKPELGLAFNAGWGTFTGNKAGHQGVVIRDYPRGYYEVGVMFNNLLKAKVLGLLKGGLGLGVFHKVGYYSSSQDGLSDLAFQITYTLRSI